MEAQLDTWASMGVRGHFNALEDSPLKEWQLLSEQAAASMAKMVGAAPEEVAAMGTLTMNLHCLLASFYKPSETKRKILMDWKAFPSDHVCFSPGGKKTTNILSSTPSSRTLPGMASAQRRTWFSLAPTKASMRSRRRRSWAISTSTPVTQRSFSCLASSTTRGSCLTCPESPSTPKSAA